METSTPRKKKEEPEKKRNFELENHCVRNWCLRVPSCEQVPNPFEKSLKRFWIWTKCKNSHLAFFSHIICANGIEQGRLVTKVMVGFLYGTNTVYYLSFFCQFMSLLFFCLILILSWNMCISFVKTQTMGINILQEKIGRQFYKWLLFIGVPCSSNILAHNLSIQKRLKWCKHKLKKVQFYET